eukprot:GHVS01016139.1.p1 GENE.GHVS01016139.1~~GHVS01016139.1.p1  ORF type:complete len:139 (+),score=14.28 GHVS01016139.1:1101-1517(+)
MNATPKINAAYENTQRANALEEARRNNWLPIEHVFIYEADIYFVLTRSTLKFRILRLRSLLVEVRGLKLRILLFVRTMIMILRCLRLLRLMILLMLLRILQMVLMMLISYLPTNSNRLLIMVGSDGVEVPPSSAFDGD